MATRQLPLIAHLRGAAAGAEVAEAALQAAVAALAPAKAGRLGQRHQPLFCTCK